MRSSYEYAYLRVVRVAQGESINVGVILFCRTQRFLAVKFQLDEQRLAALDRQIDPAIVRAHLALIPRICAGEGPIGRLGQAEAFHWLVHPHSTVIQTSEVHTGLCHEPAAVLAHLFEEIRK